MIVVGEEKKPSLDELAHFGVKGMHWGQRKAEEPAHPNYTKGMRKNDESVHGKAGVRRINERMNRGASRKEAQHSEDVRRATTRLIAIGAAYAVTMLVAEGSMHVSNLAEANRSAARTAGPAISSTSAGTPYIKPRGGAHDITTLK